MIRRGAVWWANLPAPSGSAPGFRRPVVVVSSNAFNASEIRTVVVVVLTSNVRVGDAPGNLRVPAGETGLPKDSVANVSQVFTIGKGDLTELAGHLRPATLARLADGLRLALDL